MKINKKIYTILMALICGIPLLANAAGGKISVARAFYELAGRNQTQKIENLIQKGYSLESVDERGYNAICLSVIRQNHKAYKVLSSYGASEHPQCLKKIPDSAYRRFFGLSIQIRIRIQITVRQIVMSMMVYAYAIAVMEIMEIHQIVTLLLQTAVSKRKINVKNVAKGIS